MILATEMSKHFEHLGKFTNLLSLISQEDSDLEVSFLPNGIENLYLKSLSKWGAENFKNQPVDI